jgi:hypothetical protein
MPVDINPIKAAAAAAAAVAAAAAAGLSLCDGPITDGCSKRHGH